MNIAALGWLDSLNNFNSYRIPKWEYSQGGGCCCVCQFKTKESELSGSKPELILRPYSGNKEYRQNI